jgi:hypothetical protein
MTAKLSAPARERIATAATAACDSPTTAATSVGL